MWPQAAETKELLEGARSGERLAVDQLLARHRGSLRRLIELRLDPAVARRVDASDVVQEVLIEAARRLPDYLRQAEMPFHLWLRRIALDRIIDAYRRHRLAERRSVDREQPLAATAYHDRSSFELAFQLADPKLTPAAAAMRRELAGRFEAAIARLDEQDREVLLMRHFEQLSNQEVARALELSEAAAGMRYLRALRRLRAVLAGGGMEASSD